MNEKIERKKIRKLLCFSIGMIVFLFMAGMVTSKIFLVTFQEVTEESMLEEISNYTSRIEKQVDNNFQMLNTLSSFIGTSEMDEKSFFEEALKKAEAQNDFLLFGYFDQVGRGVISADGQNTQIMISSMQEEVQEIIRYNFQGEAMVSDTFVGELSSKRVLVYGVPVYRDGAIVGSLLVSDPVDGFSSELGDKKLNYGNGYMHLVDSKGKFLIRGDEAAVKEEVVSVLEEPYLSGEQAREVRQKLKERQSVEFTFLYNSEEYNALLKPISINDWYLFSINSIENANQEMYVIVYVAAAFFVAVVVLFFGILMVGYRETQKSAQRLREIAYYDRLTGLYNIQRFMELCEETSEKVDGYSIIVVNIRQFKFINEIFGKNEADKLLCYIGQVLKESLGSEEYVCRESADYFYLFLQDTKEEILQKRVERILEQIVHPSMISKSTYQLKLWCGVAVSDTEKNVQDIMTHAMFAMATSKRSPHKKYIFFDLQLHEQEQWNNYVENHARDALKKREFTMFLQPKVRLKDQALIGAEALVRWTREDGTIMPPSMFIPLFEANGFCVHLDRYMVEEACVQICKWREAGLPVLPISINQSRLTFYKEHYVEDLCEILQKYNVSASWITLEILEGLILEDAASLNQRLEDLRAKGFRISMDDFGTGYSSLNSLGKLSIDEIKLDRGFLKEASEDKNKLKMIMEQIVQLSKKLSIATVVEGVETEGDECFIQEIGCDIAQGYFYGRPVPVDVFTREILGQETGGLNGR